MNTEVETGYRKLNPLRIDYLAWKGGDGFHALFGVHIGSFKLARDE